MVTHFLSSISGNTLAVVGASATTLRSAAVAGCNRHNFKSKAFPLRDVGRGFFSWYSDKLCSDGIDKWAAELGKMEMGFTESEEFF